MSNRSSSIGLLLFLVMLNFACTASQSIESTSGLLITDGDQQVSDSPSPSLSDESSATDPESSASSSPESSPTPSPSPSSSNLPKVLVTVFMHSEDSSHGDTPDFSAAASYNTYVAFRTKLLEFADKMYENDVDWDFESDWNFTKAVIAYEAVPSPIPSISPLMAQTNGKNIYRYMAEDLGVQMDPHSHEGSDLTTSYNYADVAYLYTQTGVTPSGIVGGHVINGSTYQNWPRFKAAVSGLAYPSFSWTFTALMGGGTASHVNQLSGSGIWFPLAPTSTSDYDNFWIQDDTNTLLPSIGGWEASTEWINALITQMNAGTIRSDRIYTANIAINHSDLVVEAYCGEGTSENTSNCLTSQDRIPSTTVVNPDAIDQVFEDKIQPLLDLQSSGLIQIMNFNDVLDFWREHYNAKPNMCKNDSESSTVCIQAVSVE